MIVGILVVGIALLYFPWKWNADRQVRSSALEQSKASAARGDNDLAIRHLDRLLADSPNDIPALDAKAKILAEACRTSNRWLTEAVKVHDLLVRLDPQGEGRLETRRKLAELYILYSDMVRKDWSIWNDAMKETEELRYQASVAVSQELLRIERESQPPIEDGAAHRLLAMAYMGEMPNLTSKASREADLPQLLRDAKAELVEALRIDPSDLLASEKLAELYMTRLNDPVEAEKTLDHLLATMPKSIEVRIARYRAFNVAKQPEKAQAELDAAILLAPQNAELRVRAAIDALARHETSTARQHLDAIPAGIQKGDLRFKVLLGQVEFAEQHPDEAIDQWRQGLSLVGGADVDLTWYLALSTIRLGGPRLGDAVPLIHQFLRLSKDDKNGRGLFLEALYDQRIGHPSDAIAKFERVVRVNRGDLLLDAYMSLGACYESIGELEKALGAFQSASQAAPTASAPRRAIARLHLAKNPEQAASDLVQSLNRAREEKLKDDPATLFDLIRIRLSQQFQLPIERRRWQEVEDLFQRVERVKRGTVEDGTYRGLYAEYLVASNRGEAAIKMAEEATQREDRKLAATWLTLAALLERQNRRVEAIQVLDRGMAADAAGDHGSLRIAKAQLQINDGRGQAARETLSRNIGNVQIVERPEVYRAIGNLCRSLGDRDGARSSYLEWARLVPESVEPAQALLNFAETYGDEEAAKFGLEVLRSGRARNDPYALTAQALELLRVDRNRPGPPPADRLDQAERLVAELNKLAPSLSWRALIEGRILEFRGNLKEAAVWYRKALNMSITGPALPRLIEVYMKLGDDDQLARLEREFQVAFSQSPNVSKEFARVSLEIARKLGDKKRVEYFASQLVEGKAETYQLLVQQARLLDSIGQTGEAEQKLQENVKSRPQDPIAWYSLIKYQSDRRTPADVARTINQARATYKGDRPDLFAARCYRFGEDKANAAIFYQKAKDKAPNDVETLRGYIEFCEWTDRDGEIVPILRKALSLDPQASWAAKTLALRISSKPDPSTWSEAWSLVAPGSLGAGDSPEDRLIQATILARSPDSARRSEAVTAFASLVDDLPITNPLAVDARIRLAQAMLEVNRPGDAWNYIAPLADDQSRFNLVALTIGIESLARSGKGEEAQRRFDRLIEQVPKWPQAPLLKAWVLMAKGKSSEAFAELKSAYSSTEKTAEGESIGTAIFDLMVQFGDYEGAYEIGQRLAARWPRAAWNLAKIQYIRKQYDEVLAACRKSMEAGGVVEAREASRFAAVAAIANRSNLAFVKQAEVIGQAALAKAPNDYNIYVFMASIDHLEGRYADEIASYQRALELNPTNVDFLNNMAWTLSEGLGKYSEAFNQVEDAIRRFGVTPDFLDTRGVIHARLGHMNQAIADLEASIKLKPQASTYYHLARVYHNAGNLVESRRYRDLAWKANFNLDELDPTDRTDLDAVMGQAKPNTGN